MADVQITKERRDARHGRYVAGIAGTEGAAEITFIERGADLISADHTGAPEAMRGTGAAAALVAHMVEDARRNGFRIIPAPMCGRNTRSIPTERMSSPPSPVRSP